MQAVLVATHLEGAAPGHVDTLRVAARVAGVPSDLVAPDRLATEGAEVLAETIAEAHGLGVAAVPTIYRHGPPVTIRTTPAVGTGSARRRLEVIDGMLADDGLWSLTKP